MSLAKDLAKAQKNKEHAVALLSLWHGYYDAPVTLNTADELNNARIGAVPRKFKISVDLSDPGHTKTCLPPQPPPYTHIDFAKRKIIGYIE